MVERMCLGLITAWGQANPGPQNHLYKLAAVVGRLLHHTGCLIDVSVDDDSGVRAKMEIP
jgi:hypothetical protein